MIDLTPARLLQNLADLSRRLDDTQRDLVAAEQAAVQTKHRADLAEAKAFISAEGSVEVRKRLALIETDAYRVDAELADAGVKATRSAMAVLRTKIDVGRTLVSATKVESAWGGAA